MSSLSSFAVASSPSGLARAAFPTRLSSHFVSPVSTRLCRVGVKCSYTDGGVKQGPNSTTIDIVADVKTERVVVLGGSGFVGSAICKAAVSKGIDVLSLSRSGRPSYSGSWVDQVTWVIVMLRYYAVKSSLIPETIQKKPGPNVPRTMTYHVLRTAATHNPGDVFYANWDEVLPGATAVISTLGGFGSEEQMQRINGEANVVAVTAAKEYGIPKFVLISVHDYNLPSFLLTSGYFTGKRKAEAEVLSNYPNSGVVLRPGFIYGKRRVDGFEIPLDLIGEPLEKFLLATTNFTKPLNGLPASDLLLAPPVSVDDVAFAAINGVADDDFFGVFTIEQIKEAAANVKVW